MGANHRFMIQKHITAVQTKNLSLIWTRPARNPHARRQASNGQAQNAAARLMIKYARPNFPAIPAHLNFPAVCFKAMKAAQRQNTTMTPGLQEDAGQASS